MERDEEMDESSFDAEDGIRGAAQDSLSEGDDEGSDGEGGHKKSWGKPPLWIILVAFFALVCLVLAAVGLYTVKTRRAAEAAEAALAKIPSSPRITRPIPQPDCREMIDFLIVYKVDGQDMITCLRMETWFQSLMKYANFRKQTVVFRDTVYNFLLHQNAADNSARSWHSVLGKNLLDYLRVKLPESCPDKIRLTQVENH